MASGMRRMVINTQERAISGDVNRLQDFKAKDVAEMERYLMNVSAQDDLEAGASITEYSAVENPLRAEIINGLLVRPVGGALDLTVDPGLLYALAPDAGVDDSNYKYVRSAGIPSAGTLAMTPNSSGVTRMDIVECQVTNVVAASESRDIFNEVTGLFSPATVSKEKVGALTFRVRSGIPVSGWLPLLVASVPTGTTTNDTITFWDVRPLVNDRANTIGNLSRDIQIISPATQLTFDRSTDTTKLIARGFVEAISGHGRRLGGRMRRGTPGTDADFVDLQLAANEDGTTFPANGIAYLYLATPYGLPRWARYTDGPLGRVPRSPRGIPVLSYLAPRHLKAYPSGSISLPAATGLGVVDEPDLTCIAAIPIGSTGPKDFYSLAAVGRKHYFRTPTAAPSTALINLMSGSLTSSSASWTLVQSTQFPPHARALLVKLRLVWGSVAAGDTGQLENVYVNIGTGAPGVSLSRISSPGRMFDNATAGTRSVAYETVLWVPIDSIDYPTVTPTGNRTLTVNFLITWFLGTSQTPTSGGMEILGWETV